MTPDPNETWTTAELMRAVLAIDGKITALGEDLRRDYVRREVYDERVRTNDAQRAEAARLLVDVQAEVTRLRNEHDRHILEVTRETPKYVTRTEMDERAAAVREETNRRQNRTIGALALLVAIIQVFLPMIDKWVAS